MLLLLVVVVVVFSVSFSFSRRRRKREGFVHRPERAGAEKFVQRVRVSRVVVVKVEYVVVFLRRKEAKGNTIIIGGRVGGRHFARVVGLADPERQRRQQQKPTEEEEERVVPTLWKRLCFVTTGPELEKREKIA